MRLRSLLLSTMVGCIAVSACARHPGESTAAEKALAELQRRYDELRASDNADPVQWAKDDLENIGDWEYRVETVAAQSPEALVAKLNEFGDERWEVFWVERNGPSLVLYLKRSSISYLRSVPISQLGGLIGEGSGGEQ